MSKTLAQVPHRQTLDVDCLLASETSSLPPGPALRSSLPQHPTLACLKGKARRYSRDGHGDIVGLPSGLQDCSPSPSRWEEPAASGFAEMHR